MILKSNSNLRENLDKMQSPIIVFHSVARKKNPNWIRSYLTLELKYFESLLKFIKKKKYKTFFISEMNKEEYHYNDSVGLCFDDGYLDNFVYAYPLMKKYGIKGTIFCSTQYIDKKANVRPTLEDVWSKNIKEDELQPWGFLSVPEMKLMENSGLIDIQSHLVTHDKYPVSDKIINFHNPQNQDIEYYFHENQGIKPYYIDDESIINSIPYGMPLFEEKPAIVSPRVWINEDFKSEIVDKLRNYNFEDYNFKDAMEVVYQVYSDYKEYENIIMKEETAEAYNKRINYEILHSKRTLESQLNKEIDVICWPHGGFTKSSIDIARKAGYKKIHFVENKIQNIDIKNDLFTRTGMANYMNNRFLTMLKIKARMYNSINKFPYPQIASIYRKFKNIL